MRSAQSIVAVLVLLATYGLAQQPERANEQKADGTTRLTLQVRRESNNEPVPDAHVVVRFVEGRFLIKDKRVAWQAKTNRNGTIVFSDIPTGSVQVQVIAKGFQTYGDRHELSKPQEELTIRLQTPQGQVSSY